MPHAISNSMERRLLDLMLNIETKQTQEIAALQKRIRQLEEKLLTQQGQITGAEKGIDALCTALEAFLVPPGKRSGPLN